MIIKPQFELKEYENGLYLVSTPLGNLKDITLRAIEVLQQSDYILCEDTRRSLKLLNNLKIKKRLISYHKFNEKKQINNVIEHINKGKILSLISDAGTPLLSDPGRILVNECINNEIKVVPIPGASSITSALSISGFNDQFLFYGFLPKTINELEKVLDSLSRNKFTLIFFIPSKKINFYLDSFKKYFSGRKIIIAKEITKIHEEFIRCKVSDIKKINIYNKGELTIVFSEIKEDTNSFGFLNESDKKKIN